MALKENRVTFRAVRDALYREGPLTLGTIYGMPRGGRRRKLLLQWLATPDEQGRERCIYVNNRWQPNLVDPDLQYLLKRGLLIQCRDRGRKRSPLNRSSNKRQSYLVLAPTGDQR